MMKQSISSIDQLQYGQPGQDWWSKNNAHRMEGARAITINLTYRSNIRAPGLGERHIAGTEVHIACTAGQHV